MKHKISLAIISLNEEKKIERCIRSAAFVDEVIVIDSGSKDRTVEIARSCGANVQIEKWRGFRDQKQFAVNACRNNWILSLDADEALSPELAKNIENRFTNDMNPSVDAFEFSRRSFYLGRWIVHGGWYPDRQTRLFHKSRASWQGGQHVHERVEAARCERIPGDLLHWPFDDLSEQINTNNRYSSLGAAELGRKGKAFSLFALLLKPASKFIECYVLKRGFLDGMAGFIIAVGAAYSVFLKWGKLWEKTNSSEGQP